MSSLGSQQFPAPGAPSDPLPDVRAALIAEDIEEWQERLSPFTARGARIDMFDSAMAALPAIASASADPYRVILLGRQVRGMDAGVLGAAIMGNPRCSGAQLAVLGTHGPDDAARFAADGFSACIDKTALPGALMGSLDNVWQAAARSSDRTRLLVADDHPVNLEVAKHLLEQRGFACDVAHDGAQAAAMHAAQPYALILMDCEMPVLDGFDATRRIRAGEGAGRRVPIIALTAADGDAEREKCLAAGMDDFLSKPLRPQTLGELLARWLPFKAAAGTGPGPACEDELEAIHEMFGADFAELASLYRRDGPPRLAMMNEAHAAADGARLAKVAHALGGSSASIGATGLSALCKDLEMHARSGALDGCREKLDTIEAEYRRVCDKLQVMLAR